MRAVNYLAASSMLALALGAIPAAAQTSPPVSTTPLPPPASSAPNSAPNSAPLNTAPPAQQAAPPAQPAPPATAQQAPRPRSDKYQTGELVREGHRFFGGVTRELAQVIEKAVSRWGQPNGYVLGQEGGGAVVVGLRYGDGTLYTKNAGDLRVFWEGPSVGFDWGGEGARTMMLVYNLPATSAIYNRFIGIDGSAYLVGGFGMTALTINDIVVVPIRSGVGLRLGANIGYLKFTPNATWNPF